MDRYGLVRFGRKALPLLRTFFIARDVPSPGTAGATLAQLKDLVLEHDAEYGKGPAL